MSKRAQEQGIASASVNVVAGITDVESQIFGWAEQAPITPGVTLP